VCGIRRGGVELFGVGAVRAKVEHADSVSVTFEVRADFEKAVREARVNKVLEHHPMEDTVVG